MSRRRRTKAFEVVGVWLVVLVANCAAVVATGSNFFVDVALKFTQEPEDAVVVKHSQTALHCSASGSNTSEIVISWRKDGEVLSPDTRTLIHPNGSLTIQNFARQHGDEGVYECVASAGSSSALVSRRARLQEAVLGSFSGHPSSIKVPLRGNARFECVINGIPKPNITWRKNGYLLPPSERFILLTSGVLQLLNVASSDVGSYSCRGSSYDHESDSHNAELTLDSGAEAIRILSRPKDQEVEIGSSVTFECLPSLSNYSVLWSRQDGIPLPLNRARTFGSGNLEIRDVRETDAANYSCRIVNAPTGHADAQLTVTVPPRFHSPSKLGVEARAQTIRIVCEFTGQPPPTVTWTKNGQTMTSCGRIKIQSNTLIISQSMDTDSALYQCWAENSAGRNGTVIPLTIQSSGKDPSPPTGLRVTSKDSRSIELTWNPPHNSDLLLVGYSVHYYWSDLCGESQEVIKQPPKRITNLLPFTNYTFFIKAYSKGGASVPSQYIVQATGEDVPLAAPEVHVSQLTNTSLQIKWDALQSFETRGSVTEYKIFYRKQNDPAKEITVLGNVLEYVLTGLEPNGKYSVRVLAGNGAGFPQLEEDRWPWVSPIVSETGIPNLQIHILNATTLQISWDPPEVRPEIGFQISYNLIGEEAKVILLVEDVVEHTLYGLHPDSVYDIKIGIFDNGYQYKRIIRTPPLGKSSSQSPRLAPVILETKSVNETAIKVSWKMPATEISAIIYYTVVYVPTATKGDRSQEMSLNSTGTSVVIAGLMPMTEYQIVVRSYTAEGPGPFSPAITWRTEEGRPPALQQLTYFLQEPTVVQLNWKMPPHASAIVSQYVVSYCEDNLSSNHPWKTHTENGSLCYTVLHGLKGRTVYQVRLHAENRKGAGPPSSLKVLTGIPYDEEPSNDRLMGIIIGIGISGGCIIICVIIILLRNRCFPPPRRSSASTQHVNGFATPLRCNGFVSGHTDGKCEGHEPDGTTPMLTQSQDHETVDKLEFPSSQRVDLWSSVDDRRTHLTNKSTTVV